MVEVTSLVKRHGHLHKVNIKYGYVIIGLSVLYIAYREVALFYHKRAWENSRRSTSKLGLVDIPVAYYAVILFLVSIIVEFFNLNTEHFNVHIKRFGRISYSLTPLSIFLSLRPCPFHLDNYLDTLKLHLWTSRTVVLFALAHGVGYLIKWGTSESYKIFRALNFLGYVIFLFCVVLAVVNWGPIRHRLYRYFYLIHNITVYLFIFGIILHARPGVFPIAVIDILMIVYQQVIKFRSIRTVTIDNVVEHDGSDLKIVHVPRKLLPDFITSGSHCRLAPGLRSSVFWLGPSHPYTITGECDSSGNYMSLLLKESKFKIILGETYTIQPYFESSLPEMFFSTAENVNIVCGGSGISFGIPIFTYFKRKLAIGSTDLKLKLVWITPKDEDLYILRELGITGIEVFVTRGSGDQDQQGASLGEDPTLESASASIAMAPNSSSDLELQSLNGTDVSNTASGRNGKKQSEENNVKYIGRPDLESILRPNLAQTIDYANKWILACGPKELVSDCEQITKSQKCRFFSEEYAM